ncbi:MAG TPA: hypothetical protein VKH65_09640 [Myxococcales bacterium]|nr:hypothetical protein [Myxococcales bacterium]
MIARAPLLLAAALCALPRLASADETPRPPQTEQQSQQAKPLSDEDAEIVRQLALLEQVDLVRNLDLFEPQPDDGPQAKQQPDAGAREP